MLEILAHSDLSHESVFISVHACELSDVCEDILDTISELESIDVSETILHMRIDNELHESEDFSAEMEGITET